MRMTGLEAPGPRASGAVWPGGWGRRGRRQKGAPPPSATTRIPRPATARADAAMAGAALGADAPAMQGQRREGWQTAGPLRISGATVGILTQSTPPARLEGWVVHRTRRIGPLRDDRRAPGRHEGQPRCPAASPGASNTSPGPPATRKRDRPRRPATAGSTMQPWASVVSGGRHAPRGREPPEG